MNATQIINALKQEYDGPTPTAIYPHPEGYLVVAPNTEDLMDYNDPFYIVSNDLKTVTKLGARNLMHTLSVLKKKPLWERDNKNEKRTIPSRR